MKNFLKYYWPSLLVLGVIVYATLASDPTGDVELPPIPMLDKMIHAIMFGGLAGSIIFCYLRQSSPRQHIAPRTLWIIGAIAAITGIFDEFAQALLTRDRSAEFLDWIADCAGICVALLTAPAASRKVLNSFSRTGQPRDDNGQNRDIS